MRIHIQTLVKSSWEQVQEGFDATLFKKLSPPFPKVELQRFDGCEAGDKVQLRLNFLLFSQKWHALVTENGPLENGFFFIDIGEKLPFPLRRWQHRHEIKSAEGGTIISDDIQYSTGLWLIDLLAYPLLWAQFIYRKPVYRKIFK